MKQDAADTIVLRAAVESVKEARDAVAKMSDTWGIPGEIPCLVVSELATNAIVHGASGPTDHIVVRAYEMDNGKRVIEVWDRGETWPEPGQVPEDDTESGRGLLLVDALTDGWGVRPLNEGGKVVFAKLSHATDV
ncbi:ATP-binding protein [Actinomadura sediminis]|uniref:ATP-binding protein n=1 Tax=Actinomadura sediminis TaxID=1038904 RepID=A0ABW3EN09_9ACTN